MPLQKKLPLIYSLIGLSVSMITHASGPVWTIIPQTPTQFSITAGQSTTVQYQVTNQAQIPKTLMMSLQNKAVQQMTTGSSVCTNPFTLNAQQSCLLRFEINGSALDEPIIGGPIVCRANPNQTPNLNQCYQPVSSQQLSVTRLPTPASTNITASLSSLALSVRCPTAGGSCAYDNPALQGTPRIITITNNGNSLALNVHYVASSLPTGTTITPTSCDIAPSGTCNFTVTPGEIPSAAPGDLNPTPITLTFSGTNTNTLTTEVAILTYGSVYQSGYVFSINDTTVNTSSAAGSIVALMEQSTATFWQDGCSPFTTPSALYHDGGDPMPTCGTISAPLIQNIQSH